MSLPRSSRRKVMKSMSAAADYRVQTSLLETGADASDNYKASRLFLTLASAFKDVDERAIKRPKNTINRIIGPPFAQ
jgi:hypothetical protein